MQGSPFQGITSLGLAGGSKPSALPSLPGLGSVSSPLSPSVSKEDGEAFGGLLANAMGTVNETMKGSSTMTKALTSGRLDNLHSMTIAGAKSGIMMKLTTNITSKLAQATTQLFQMQI
jgi:flagellar hook-basal body complex protein FliE